MSCVYLLYAILILFLQMVMEDIIPLENVLMSKQKVSGGEVKGDHSANVEADHSANVEADHSAMWRLYVSRWIKGVTCKYTSF